MAPVYVENLTSSIQRDVADINVLLNQLAPTRSKILTERDLADVLAAHGTTLYVARGEDRRIVGMATLVVARVLSGVHGHVEDVVTHAQLRRSGVASQLMEAARIEPPWV